MIQIICNKWIVSDFVGLRVRIQIKTNWIEDWHFQEMESFLHFLDRFALPVNGRRSSGNLRSVGPN